MHVSTRLSAQLSRLMWATRKLRIDLETALFHAETQSRAHALLLETLHQPGVDTAQRQRRSAARYEESLRNVGRGLATLRLRAWQLQPTDRLELEALGAPWCELRAITEPQPSPLHDIASVLSVLREIEQSLATRTAATYR